MYTPWLREGPLYKSVSNKCKGVQTVATIQVIFWAIIKFRPEALVQIWHPPDHKWET